MPLYEFKCECGNLIERLVPMDTIKIICGCGKIAEQQISRSSFKLNGTGWYETDFKTMKVAE